MSIENVHITFVHGMGNKPSEQDLRRIWLEALALPVEGDHGFDPGAVGVKTSFVYWADLFYSQPLPASDYEAMPSQLDASVPMDASREASVWMERMSVQYPDAEGAYEEVPPGDRAPGYERIPLPWPLKKRLMAAFLREAHDYLFNKDGIQDVIRKRVLDAMAKAKSGARKVLVGHSQGSFIAYDVLTAVKDCPQIEGLLTLGSPLGVDEVQDRLVWTRDDGFPAKLNGDWVNVYDPFDVVARVDPRLANDFKKKGQEIIHDEMEENWGVWRHSATKYLKGPLLRRWLRQLCDRGVSS